VKEAKPVIVRETTAAQVARDLVRMAVTIAAHRGVSIAEVLDPIIREPLTAIYAEVGEEMQAVAKAGVK
jgi:hypothetical protein